jgi:UDP-N-acetylmuramoyl-L-alanyl-D-glutamate--2,6-diaminopimelate ligase
MFRKLLAKYTPEKIKILYHIGEAFLAALWYGFPGKQMTIIGITGTKGKTSTANLVWSVLHAGGFTTGQIGTANIRIGDLEIPNMMHMTMPGPWVTQKLLRRMKKDGCQFVVMEVTSEGLKYYRHIGITFRAAIFTNLSPEHLASHNNDFETYKNVKGRLFATLKNTPKSISIINTDSEHAPYYTAFPAEKLLTYGLWSGNRQARNITETETGTTFELDSEKYTLNILGAFNIANALPAIIVGEEFGLSHDVIRKGLAAVTLIPGRMEKINEGQPYTVIVDYAHEKLSINTLLDAANQWRQGEGRIITVIGAEGGGRDPRKREHMGRAAATKSDYVIVTTTDPYDDDPEMLVEAVASFAEMSGKKRGETLFTIVDRKEGLRRALSIAREEDIVLITGMGAQETMIVKGGPIPWNEREIVRKLIRETLTTSS